MVSYAKTAHLPRGECLLSLRQAVSDDRPFVNATVELCARLSYESFRQRLPPPSPNNEGTFAAAS
jgi:hypothetical protein